MKKECAYLQRHQLRLWLNDPQWIPVSLTRLPKPVKKQNQEKYLVNLCMARKI